MASRSAVPSSVSRIVLEKDPNGAAQSTGEVSGLLIIFNGITDRLIPLFAVGAFGAFTMPRAGMVAHWRRQGRRLGCPSLLINALGAITTAGALVVILMAEFMDGAWMTVLLISALIAVYLGIRRHYARVKREIRPPTELQTRKVQRLKVVIPIDGWNRVTERALRFALEISDDITAIHVAESGTDPELIDIWRTRVEEPACTSSFPKPRLEIIPSPYRSLIEPVMNYIQEIQSRDRSRLIAVIVPELVQPRWWEYLLHNHTAALLKTNFLLKGNDHVIVINTPWYMRKEPSA